MKQADNNGGGEQALADALRYGWVWMGPLAFFAAFLGAAISDIQSDYSLGLAGDFLLFGWGLLVVNLLIARTMQSWEHQQALAELRREVAALRADLAGGGGEK